MDDKELLLLLGNSLQDGIRKLTDIYEGLVWSVVNGKLSGKFSREDIEECVSDIFGCTSDVDAAWLCSINGGIHKNQIINERLAWNVIDKAGLADEAELERRRQFKRKS